MVDAYALVLAALVLGTGSIADQVGHRRAFVAGLAVFTQAPVSGGYLEHVLPAVALLGVGAGLAFPALMTLAMSGVSAQDAGLASGLVNTTGQVGGALGLAVLATVSASRTTAAIRSGQPATEALTDGYHLAFWIAFGLVIAAIAVAATVLRPGSSPAAVPEPVRELAAASSPNGQ